MSDYHMHTKNVWVIRHDSLSTEQVCFDFVMQTPGGVKLRWERKFSYEYLVGTSPNLIRLQFKQLLYNMYVHATQKGWTNQAENCIALHSLCENVENIAGFQTGGKIGAWGADDKTPWSDIGHTKKGFESFVVQTDGLVKSVDEAKEKLKKFQDKLNQAPLAQGGTIQGTKSFTVVTVKGTPGKVKYHSPPADFYKTFPCLHTNVPFPCPNPNHMHAIQYNQLETLEASIMTLNDECRWTREQIASWIRQLEREGKINQKAKVKV